MTATVSTPVPIAPRSGGGPAVLWVRITQSESSVGEEWQVANLPIFGTLVGYRTRLVNSGGTVLTLRPEIGCDAGFTFGGIGGTGLGRYRRRLETVIDNGTVPLLLLGGGTNDPGVLQGRSGLSRNLTGSETLVTDLFILPEATPGASVPGSEGRWGSWEVSSLSTYPLQVASGLTLSSTLQATDPILVDGAVEVEVWIDFEAVSPTPAAPVDPSDTLLRFEMRREPGSGPWAPILFEDVANATVASGVGTLPNAIYEVSDTSWEAATISYPATRHYVVPARNWSGELRVLVGDGGGDPVNNAEASVFLLARSGR